MEKLRVRAYGILVDDLASAATAGDEKRLEQSSKRVLAFEAGTDGLHPPLGSGGSRLLDTWRIVLTMLLVTGLIVVIIFVVVNEQSADAAPYVSIFSGLVGIAIGWLFGTTSRDRQRGGG